MGKAIALAVAFFFLYETWCPLERIIGIPCPGCNMLSALYHLCLGHFEEAIYFHPLVLFFCLYVLIEIILYYKYRTLQTKYAKGLRIIFLCMLFIVYVYRMITIYPSYPMQYNEHNYLSNIMHLFS